MKPNNIFCLTYFAALAAIIGATFSSSFIDLHELWQDNNNGYSHGYLVLAVSAYLLFSQRGQLGRIDFQPSLSALLALSALTALVSIADFLNINALITPLLIPIIWLSFGVIGGTTLLRTTAFPILFLLFAMPIWDLLLPILQQITVHISQTVLQSISIAALYHGATVTLPYGDVIIEESCSGLRYLTIALTLSSLYFYLNFRSTPYRGTIIVIVAIIIAMIANWIRVTYIIYVAYESKMQDPLVADHYNFGWIIFSISMIPFFLLARYLQPEPAEAEETQPEEIKTTTKKRLSFKLCCLASLSLVAVFCLPKLVTHKKHLPASLPTSPVQQLEAWYVKPSIAKKSDWQAKIRGFDQRQRWQLINKTSYKKVHLDIFSYNIQSQGKELISDHNTIIDNKHYRSRELAEQFINGIKLTPTVINDSGSKKRLIIYWYNVAGVNSSNKYIAKLLETANLFQKKVSSSAYVISTNCRNQCTEELAELDLLATALLQ